MPESKEKSSLTHSFTHTASLTALSSSHSVLHFRLSLFDAVPRPSKGERKKREEKMKKAHTQSGVSVLRLFGITLSPLFALSHSHTLNEFPFRLSPLLLFLNFGSFLVAILPFIHIGHINTSCWEHRSPMSWIYPTSPTIRGHWRWSCRSTSTFCRQSRSPR